MCSFQTKLQAPNVSNINGGGCGGRGGHFHQPNRNRVPLFDCRSSPKTHSSPAPAAALMPLTPPSDSEGSPPAITSPVTPKIKSPRQPAVKRSGNDPHGLNSSAEKVLIPRGSSRAQASLLAKKSRRGGGGGASVAEMIVDDPGSIAAAMREQAAIMQEQRKMRIAHYGRTKSAKYERRVPTAGDFSAAGAAREDKRCSFITPNSDPIYVAYHDEEWGVPVHDDNMLFELLVLTGAQVGSDWAIVLKKRQDFREAFSGFDAQLVSKYTEKKINSISVDYGIDLSQVRGAVDNSIKILEVKKQFGTFSKYLWGFVNHKQIATQYKWSNKIPVKTSKSETISKDMVRRGFRYVGPTVMHSFMQAAGLTNDHLTTCPRHIRCAELAAASLPRSRPTAHVMPLQ
ncbi:unnamed protein product [Cuscuta epithymum]|uniref:DNA-3-methyladenine glycosylase I n=1 Tax=Cuscuta epithymum TaxID=186058 RepID=A0AAV0ECI7_9ASTE|nr:unnamed protein product [Cuscuta epithymum]